MPLLFSVMLPGMPLLSLSLAVLLLGALGAILAWSLFGSPLLWGLAMMAGGVILTFIGAQLDIVG